MKTPKMAQLCIDELEEAGETWNLYWTFQSEERTRQKEEDEKSQRVKQRKAKHSGKVRDPIRETS